MIDGQIVSVRVKKMAVNVSFWALGNEIIFKDFVGDNGMSGEACDIPDSRLPSDDDRR